jgi:hypothetical protein
MVHRELESPRFGLSNVGVVVVSFRAEGPCRHCRVYGKSIMTKRAKPTPDFPLYAHSNGEWANKVEGRLRHSGPWDDSQAALARFLGEAPEASNGGQQVVSERKSLPDAPHPVKDHQKKPKEPRP